MNASETMKKIIELQDIIKSNPMEDKEDIRKYYKDIMKMIYDYKMIGRIYDYYAEDMEFYRDRRSYSKNVEDFLNEIMRFTAAFPDLTANIEDTVVCRDGDGWKIAARINFRGTNLGKSYMGPATGKNLGENSLAIHFSYLKKIDGQWKIHRVIQANGLEHIENTMSYK